MIDLKKYYNSKKKWIEKKNVFEKKCWKSCIVVKTEDESSTSTVNKKYWVIYIYIYNFNIYTGS